MDTSLDDLNRGLTPLDPRDADAPGPIPGMDVAGDRRRNQSGHILTVACPDAMGNIAAVYNFLTEVGGYVIEADHHTDPETDRFFMRVVFRAGRPGMPPVERLRERFAPIAERFRMTWAIADAARPPRVVIAVSRFGHCLRDLLSRWASEELRIDVPAIVSNHTDMEPLARWYDIPYHHLPVNRDNKSAHEEDLLALLKETEADLLVLARYMQVLSTDLCTELEGRCINIHHSFLPSFKGARPYQQAHARGVKLVGATAHYVTPDLDEGPIIEQEVIRVDHQHTAEEMVAAGRDIESIVLARAVRWHAEQRVFLNGSKTVVFR